MLDYAVRATGGVDEVAVTHLDSDYTAAAYSYEGLQQLNVEQNSDTKVKRENQIKLTAKTFSCKAGTFPVEDEASLIGLIEKTTDAPVTLKSYGKTWEDKVIVPAP